MRCLRRLAVFSILVLLTSCDVRPFVRKLVVQKTDPETQARENVTAEDKTVAAKLIRARDPIRNEIDAFRLTTRLAYNARHFDELETHAAALRPAKARFGDGSWKIEQFYDSLGLASGENEAMWTLHDQIHRDWIAAKPQSITALIAYADFLTEYAWHARGSGYANTVTDDGWRLMRERLEQSSNMLESASRLPEKDPYLWQVGLTLALGQSWSKAQYDALMRKATTAEPQFFAYDLARAYSLLPRWFGESGDWENFADEAAARPGGLGPEAYARIVTEQSRYYDNVFRESKADWDTTKRGIELMRQRYPDSLWVKHIAAYLGTLALDQEYARTRFAELGDSYLKSVWSTPERFAHYRHWAETGEW